MRYENTARYRHLRMNYLLKKFGDECLTCGSKERLEFHHIKPTGLNGNSRGMDKRMKDIEDNPDCYRLLCHTCHVNYHTFKLLYNMKLSEKNLYEWLSYIKRE